MELGHLVWFSSREHPFTVRERHCLGLECSCTDAWLTFRDVNLKGLPFTYTLLKWYCASAGWITKVA